MYQFHSFLRQNTISSSVYHIVFIHSSTNGYLSAIVNNVAMNIGVLVLAFWGGFFFVFCFLFLDIHLGVELLGHMVVLCLKS